MRRFISFWKEEYFLVVLCLVLSLLFRLYFTFIDKSVVEYDQLTYDTMAITLLKEHALLRNGQPTAYITPLYPIFLSMIYFFFGHNYLWVKIIQALLGSFTCVIIYFIAKETLGKSIALLTLFLLSIHHFLIVYGVLLLSENLFTFWVALSILFLVKFCKHHSYLYGCLFGLFASLATLTRSAYFFFPFLAIAFLFLTPKLAMIPYKKLLKYSIATTLCFLFPLSIWTMRNYFIFRNFILLGTEAGVVLYAAYNPPQGKILESSIHDDITAQACKKPEVEYGRFLIRHTILSIKREPSKLYKYIPLRLMYFFSLFDWVAFKPLGAYNFSSGFIFPLSFLGIILFFMKRQSYSHINFVLLLPVIYFVLVTIAIMGVPRMRLPIEPYLIIFAAFFVNYTYERIHLKPMVVCSLIVWYFFNYLLYLNSYSVKVIARSFFQKVGLW